MTSSTWASRDDLTTVLRPRKAEGWLQMPSAGDVAVPLGSGELDAVIDISARHLEAAGLGPDHRVVVALNSDGVSAGTLLTLAAAKVAQAAVGAGPRGRMRLLRAIKGSGASALVITPTGAMDLLARLHIEFLVDPLDLGIERIVLTGEIPSPSTERQLAMDFGAEVSHVLLDPFFATAIAHREDGALIADPEHLALAPLADDVEATDLTPGTPYELVLHPTWSKTLADTHLRTGWVTFGPDAAAAIPWPTATVGDRVLIRGQWVSIKEVTAALRPIDGIESWGLEITRPGTLDKATLKVAFDRPSLTNNKMWTGRLREAMNALTPVDIEIEVTQDPTQIQAHLVDHRGHHLGLDRLSIKPSGPAA